MLGTKRHAVSAHMESDEVEAESVRNTGDSASRARKTRMEDLSALAPPEEMSYPDFLQLN